MPRAKGLRRAAILGLGLALSMGHAVDATAPHGSPGPLSLRVRLASPDVVVGESARVTYWLTNDTADAFTGCADDWGAGVWWGPAGIRATAIDAASSCPDEGHFKLAPHATRTWTSDVKVLNAGHGEGHFAGVVRYAGETWSGETRSPIVPVVFHDPPSK